jgi:dipeptidase D
MIKFSRDTMKAVLDHFKTISAIPRCSFDASAMKEHLISFAQTCGCLTQVDDAGNVLCVKGTPRICLQAHYDMVCIGESKTIELIQEGMLLKAKNSTLGADNGMGMALMFWAMETYDDVECLFTADEEVGLIGASQFTLPLKSRYVLNLDSETEGEICIGCAGGVDVIATLALHKTPVPKGAQIYEVVAEGFLGGHSGIDIDKHISSALKVLARELLKTSSVLVYFEGGDRRNAIPKSAKAIVATHEPLHFNDTRLHVKRLEEGSYNEALVESKHLLNLLSGFAQGVREWDTTFHMPLSSINMGLVRMDEKSVRFDCAARSMDDENLAILADETQAFFEALGCDVAQEHWHGAWKPDAGVFAQKLQAIMQTQYPEVSMYAVHAGLECGELIARQAQKIEAASIGPTIRYPHSLREECDLASVARMRVILEKIMNEVD